MKQVRILIADDHEVIRRGLRTLIESHRNWTVCGEAADGRQAVRLASDLKPHVVIMDVTMPGLNGLDATRQIRQELPHSEVLILTMHESEQLVHEVLTAGARGYILKSDAGSTLADAVESLSRHQPFFTSKVSELLLKAYLDPDAATPRTESASTLTPREREIVQLIAEGKRTKEAAAVLNISVKTAETHRANLMRTLDVHSVSEIVRYAIRNNMIEP